MLTAIASFCTTWFLGGTKHIYFLKNRRKRFIPMKMRVFVGGTKMSNIKIGIHLVLRDKISQHDK